MSSQKLIPNHSSSTSESTKEKRRRRDCTKTMQVLTLLGVFVIGGLAIWILVRTFQDDAALDCSSCLPPLSPQGRPPTSSGEDDGGARNCKGKTIRVNRNQGPAGIQAAIDAACPGDTVLVAAGTYFGCLRIPQTKHGLVLKADGVVIIDATPGGFQCDTTAVGQNGITAANIERVQTFYASPQPQTTTSKQVPDELAERQDGLFPKPFHLNAISLYGGNNRWSRSRCPGDSGFPAEDLPGYNGTAYNVGWNLGPHNLVIDGFTVRNAAYTGVFISGCSSYTVQNCVLHDNAEYGVFPVCSDHGTVRNNVVFGSGDTGIYNGDDVGGLVVGNEVYGCSFGVELEATHANIFEYNNIHDNAVGVFVQWLPWLPRSHSADHVIRHNYIHNNNRITDWVETPFTGIGIYLQGASDVTIVDNRIEGNNNAGVLGFDQVPMWFAPMCDVTGFTMLDGTTPYKPFILDALCAGTDHANCQCPITSPGYAEPRPFVPFSGDIGYYPFGATDPLNLRTPIKCIPGGQYPFPGDWLHLPLPDCGRNRDLYLRNIFVARNVFNHNGENAVGQTVFTDSVVGYGIPLDLFGFDGAQHGYDVFFSSNLRREVTVSNPDGLPPGCVDTSNVWSSNGYGAAYSYQLESMRQVINDPSMVTFQWPMIFDTSANPTYPVLPLAKEHCKPTGALVGAGAFA